MSLWSDPPVLIGISAAFLATWIVPRILDSSSRNKTLWVFVVVAIGFAVSAIGTYPKFGLVEATLRSIVVAVVPLPLGYVFWRAVGPHRGKK